MTELVAQASRLRDTALSPKCARYTRRPRGFTILEIVVASSIALFIFIVGYAAISTSIRVSEESTKRIRDTENARLLFNLLEKDLQNAFPGPGNILKKVEILQPTSSYAHDPSANPSPLVVEEANTGIQASNLGPFYEPSSDILQFYTRSDLPGIRDEIVLVRYYVNRHDHTLCRMVIPYDANPPPPQPHQDPPDYADYPTAGYVCNPTVLTNVNNSDNALFENVRQMRITFQQWLPLDKRYTKIGTEMIPQAQNNGSQISYPGADSIVITVIFTDDYKRKRIEGHTLERTGDRYLNDLDRTYRSYSKVLPIPGGFRD